MTPTPDFDVILNHAVICECGHSFGEHDIYGACCECACVNAAAANNEPQEELAADVATLRQQLEQARTAAAAWKRCAKELRGALVTGDEKTYYEITRMLSRHRRRIGNAGTRYIREMREADSHIGMHQCAMHDVDFFGTTCPICKITGNQ